MLVEALHGALRDNVSFLDVLIWSMDYGFHYWPAKRKRGRSNMLRVQKEFYHFFIAKNDPKTFLKIELNLEKEFITDFKTGLISLTNSF